MGMTKEQGKEYGVDNYKRFFRITPADKVNIDVTSPSDQWFERIDYTLPSGKRRPVTVSWEPRGLFEGFTAKDTARVREAAASEDHADWRASKQSADWAGYRIADILGMDTPDKGTRERDRVKKMIVAWVKEDVLRKDNRRIEAERKDRPCLVAGENNPAAVVDIQ